MKCPFCGQEMEQGKLRSRGGLFFLPEGEGLPKLYTRAGNGKAQGSLFARPYAPEMVGGLSGGADLQVLL